MTNAEHKAFYFLIFIGFLLLAKKIIPENKYCQLPLILDRLSIKEIMSYEGIFVRINYARLRKILVITQKRSARFRVSSALGALDRKFEISSPTSFLAIA